MRRSLILAAVPPLAGCAGLDLWPDRNVRSIAIQDHLFEPEATVVQAGKPVVLLVEGVDDTALVLFSPALGIPPTRLRPHAHIRPGGRPIPDDYTTMGTRLTLEALKPGSYELVCNCHGNRVIGHLIAR